MMLLALSSAFVASPTVYARGSTTSVYALTQLQDTLLKIDPATGKNSTVGKFALHDDYNPVATPTPPSRSSSGSRCRRRR